MPSSFVDEYIVFSAAEKDLASNKQKSGGQRIDHGFRRNIPFLAVKILPLALLKHLAGSKAWLTKQWCHKLSSPTPPLR